MKLVGTLPVKPYLAKFVYSREYMEPGKALNLQNNSVISYTLKMLFTNKTNLDESDYLSYEKMNKEYTGEMRFKITSRMQAFSCFYISRKSITVFNQFLNRLFHEFLLSRIVEGVANGKDEKEIIFEFMRELDIEDDITFDAIKKANYRLRKSKKMPTIHQQSRPKAAKSLKSSVSAA